MLSRVYLVRFTRFGCAAAIRQAAACVRFAKPFIQREVHRWPCGPSKGKFYSKEELEADQKPTLKSGTGGTPSPGAGAPEEMRTVGADL